MALENLSTVQWIDELQLSEPIDTVRVVRDLAQQVQVLKKVLATQFPSLGAAAVDATAGGLKQAGNAFDVLNRVSYIASDLDDVVTPGRYAVTTGATNAPFTYMVLDVSAYNNTEFLQVAHEITSGKQAIRTKSAAVGGWTDWWYGGQQSVNVVGALGIFLATTVASAPIGTTQDSSTLFRGYGSPTVDGSWLVIASISLSAATGLLGLTYDAVVFAQRVS